MGIGLGGLSSGLQNGVRLGIGIGGIRDKRAAEKADKTARTAAVSSGIGSDEFKSYTALNPEGAQKIIDVFTGMSDHEQKINDVNLNIAGGLLAFAANSQSPEEFTQRYTQIHDQYITSGKLTGSFVSNFPEPNDPQARNKIMASLAALTEADKAIAHHLKLQEFEIKNQGTKDIDDHKTVNQKKKDQTKFELDSKLEGLKQKNKLELEGVNHTNQSARNDQMAKGKVRPEKDVNALVRNVSKNYKKKNTGQVDQYDEPIIEERSSAELLTFQRRMKKYLNDGLDEFEAESKAAQDVFKPTLVYNQETGKFE